MMREAGLMSLSAIVLFGLASSFAPVPAAHAETVTVDASIVDGIVPAIHGVNNGPLRWTDQSPCGGSTDTDLTSAFVYANVPQARSHGGGPLDIQIVWKPWPSFIGEDPADPANYDWTISDQQLAAQMAILESYIRIGPPANGDIHLDQGCDNSLKTDHKPEDFDVFAQVAKRIVMHYLDGWDNGFYYDINYCEIWNEFYIPEFWNGTDEEAAQLYEKCYDAIKPLFPNLNIGPSASRGMAGFWEYARDHGVPVDFVAPHNYSVRPQSFANQVYLKPNANWEVLFPYYGFPVDTPLVFSEWNRSINCSLEGGVGNTIPGGCYVAASLITMAEMHPANGPHNVVMGHLFSARFQIWYPDGTPRAPGVALEAYGHDLYGETPIRIASTGGRSDDPSGYVDFKVMAGKSEDNGKVNVLVAYYDVTNGDCPDNTDIGTVIPLTVDINNLPWGTGAFIWERWVHTSNYEMTLQASGSGSGGSFSTSQSMNANVLELYKLVGAATITDSDGDGLADSVEALLGTNPNKSDSDGDGLSDYDEVNYDGNWSGDPSEYDPYHPTGNPTGTDLDASSSDTDGDGVSDGDEVWMGFDPLDASSVPSVPLHGKLWLCVAVLFCAVIAFRSRASRIRSCDRGRRIQRLP
ncbi:MAG: hypothetical protein GWP08_09555 [Nitrospiraceae bacterium]|nr:hypothetical protein [Nitrospiraceae bacterium]